MSNRVVITGTERPFAQVRAEIAQQSRLIRLPLLLAVGGAALGLAPVLALSGLRGVPPQMLTRDIFAITATPVYYGMLSNLGMLVWAAAATAWLLTAGILTRLAPRHQLRGLALGAGLVTLLLLADDALMLHEDLLPRLLGLPEKVFTIGLALAVSGALIVGARRILASRYGLCLAAGGLLAASLIVDSLMPMSGLELLVEDGLKFIGIATWLAYAVVTALQALDDLRPQA